MALHKICVFAASSPGIPDPYMTAAREMAVILSEHGIAMHYGAGAVGIMGVMADTLLDRGGEVRGYIPDFMIKMGWAHPNLKDLVRVGDMHERKREMIREADAVLAMPGGVGTLEELMEVITLKQLGQFLKPIVILNTGGFYDPLIGQLQKMVDEHFMRPLHRDIWRVVTEPGQVLEAILNAPSWDGSRIKYAAVEESARRKIRTSGQ